MPKVIRKKKTARKQPHDYIGLRGCLEFELRNALTGEVVQRGKSPNLVLYAGRSWGLRKLASVNMQSSDLISSLALGTDSTAASSSNTALGAYFTYRTVTAAFSTYSTNTPYVQFTCSFESTELSNTSYNNIREFALYNLTSSGGTAFTRYVSGTYINATQTNQLLITYTLSN